MNAQQVYYLQQMGYTIWQKRHVEKKSTCSCMIAGHGLDQAPLLCCLSNEPSKSEKDLWVFLAMAFDFSQQYYLASYSNEDAEHTVCPACVNQWLNQSAHHHAIAFGNCHIEDIHHQVKHLLVVPSLSEMIANPKLKKLCFFQIHEFLCQEHLVI